MGLTQSQLQSLSDVILNETITNANTATRVGVMLESMIQNMGLSSNYRVIAGVIQNTGSGWAQIGGAHESINTDSVSDTPTGILIDHTSLGATKVVTFISGMDDFWAGKYSSGFSGGLTVSTIKVYKPTIERKVHLITHNGDGNFTFGGDTSGSYDSVTGILTINLTGPGNNVPKFWDLPATLAKSTIFHSAQNSLSGNQVNVRLLNLDGTQKNLINPDMTRFYIERSAVDIQQVLVDPQTLISGPGNIWYVGIVRI